MAKLIPIISGICTFEEDVTAEQIAPGAVVTIRNGRIHVTGSVGDNVKIDQNGYSPTFVSSNYGNGSRSISIGGSVRDSVFVFGNNNVILTSGSGNKNISKETLPGIQIDGPTGAGVKLTSNRDIKLAEVGLKNTVNAERKRVDAAAVGANSVFAAKNIYCHAVATGAHLDADNILECTEVATGATLIGYKVRIEGIIRTGAKIEASTLRANASERGALLSATEIFITHPDQSPAATASTSPSTGQPQTP